MKSYLKYKKEPSFTQINTIGTLIPIDPIKIKGPI